jgi:hypothetical protein
MEMISARLLQPGHGPGHVEPDSTLPRDVVAAPFRARTGAVAAAEAQQRTKAFYRASGQSWALALD